MNGPVSLPATGSKEYIQAALRSFLELWFARDEADWFSGNNPEFDRSVGTFLPIFRILRRSTASGLCHRFMRNSVECVQAHANTQPRSRPPSLPIEIWLVVIRHAARMRLRDAARKMLIVWSGMARCSYALQPGFRDLWQALKLRGHASVVQLMQLESFPLVRHEWAYCPKDWLAMLHSHCPSPQEILCEIETECAMGLWGMRSDVVKLENGTTHH